MVAPILHRRLHGVLLILACLLTADVVCAADPPPGGLTEGEKRGGWKPLFDGVTTTGWRNYRSDKLSDGWVVSDGILERIRNGAVDIVTTEQYRNFELSL